MLDHPVFLRDHPDVSDPLSDVLTLVEARSVLSGRLYASGAWAICFPPPERIKFSAPYRGVCWLVMDGLPNPVRVEAGDVIIVNGQRSFVLASDPAVEPVDARALFWEQPNNVARIGTGDDVLLFGGHVAIDATRADLLMDVLPPLLHVRSGTPEAGALNWLLEQLVVELSSGQPGSTLAASHLA